jgi:succinate dehydrogenase / fumarate reductase iron-sulfur subunit
MKINLKVWRQENRQAAGGYKNYSVSDISEHMSFFEMLDKLNNELVCKGEDPVAFDHDCREGICGSCGVTINGRAHGPLRGVTSCQLHMRSFKDGDTLVIEPWRAASFPVIKDLVVDRTSGGAPDANAIPIPKADADAAFDSATCIGCGACVAICKNSAAMLFVGAKVTQFTKLPQGKVERRERVKNMVAQMDSEGFGSCTNTGACEAECPKEISLTNIATLNKEYLKASLY